MKLRNASRKAVSLFLAFALLFEITYPTQVLALTGGPSQPEVQSFEPISTSDMVDLATGDFNYNIPLLDVDGYPINISYHSGITMDQEASWVGLGWNINPGVINRNMRGLPDDFDGDLVTKEINMKANKTWGITSSINAEVVGFSAGNAIGVGIGLSLGLNYNNYTGPSITQGQNVHFVAGSSAAGKLTASLGVNSSSDDGLTVQPSVSYSSKYDAEKNKESGLGINVGSSYNSRAGLQQLTIGVSYTGEKAGGLLRRIAQHYLSKGASGSYDFGMPTYTPSISTSMKSHALTGNFTFGVATYGFAAQVGMKGSFASQKIANKIINNPAYGYLYSEQGQLNESALMDFNREKDGTFNESTQCLPVTNYTFDTYAVSGQGIGGSYRPFRNTIGIVSDPVGYTTNDDADLTVELQFATLVHVGSDVSVTKVSGRSGKWKGSNDATHLNFSGNKGGSDYENVYFKEANEKTVDSDTSYYAAAGTDSPIRPSINFTNKYEPILNAVGPITRKKRDKRTQNISFLKRSEYADYAVQPIDSTYEAPGHHIAEITTLGTDGSRYVYGIAAYNKVQKEATMSLGSTNIGTVSGKLAGLNENTGIIGYDQTVDNSIANGLGMDNYFSRVTTPAYAHSYLLTSVLSPDYIDADAVRGPSDNDLGNYTRFAYKKISNYKWRVPYETNTASYNEGLKSDLQDDKANYIYGEKELWYLDSVITKNYVAVFHTSERTDGAGVNDENGGYSSNSAKMLKLDSICLYSKQDLKYNPSTAKPIKCVHFVYDYTLCKNVPNTVGGIDPTQGKLTLKSIFFSYENSNKARMSPYKFTYDSFNPNYNLKAYDRWGNYKPNLATHIGVKGKTVGDDDDDFIADSISTAEYPYVEQDTAKANQYTAAWSLKKIQLPSGGTINLTYESDDYAYVQNRPAMEMFKAVNYDNAAFVGNTLVDFKTSGKKFYFKLQNGITDINKYIDGIENLYFRFLVQIRDLSGYYKHLEYVSGYGEIDRTPGYCGTIGNLGFITLKDINLKDNNSGHYVNPIVKSAIEFGRMNMPKKVWTKDATGSFADATGMDNNEGNVGFAAFNALLNSSMIKNVKDAVVGQNEVLYADGPGGYEVAHKFVANKSFFRLNNPNQHKLGGGSRVKKIEMIDEWGKMVNNASETSNYGQTYDYNLENGTSSGVASYEPQIGGDENPWRQPLPNAIKKVFTVDDHFFQEEPVGESFFPTPNVIYSQVTVKNLDRNGVTRHATGKVVHEFYTAKDFPIILKRTNVKHVRAKDSPFSLNSIFKINVRDYMTAAQGFSIELNDMHGKPKSEKVYQEGQSTPISSIEYKYKKDPYLDGSFKLNNKCTTVEKNGNLSEKTIGESFDMVGDFREDKTTINNVALQVNIDVMPAAAVPITIPSVWPSFSRQKTRFRSATTTKVIQRFGILEETVATDLGSTVATKNLAYDAETGDVLLTQTTTNFNDQVYNLKYPAWWYYDNMGPAYQNIDFQQDNVAFNSSGIATVGTNYKYFHEGDELALYTNYVKTKGWVDSVYTNHIRVLVQNGSPAHDTYNVKVLRSGNRNTITQQMATITTLTNPLPALKTNAYENVIQASSIEFSDKRKTYCGCLSGERGAVNPYTINPYILGIKGGWRPLKSYTHLTGRSHSNYDNNTNIRKDGMFLSYSPFYKMVGSKWQMEPKNWTNVSEVTEFNALGEELENKDALGRYSSASYGYNQSLALSVAANSKYTEQGFDGFEDYKFNPCADEHFKFQGIHPDSTHSHTGKYSIKVSSGSNKTLSKQLVRTCVDSTGCRIVLSSNNVGENTKDIIASLGTGPYSFTWIIVSGSPKISLITGGVEITGTGYQVEITVRDAKRCSVSKTISTVSE